MPQSMDREVLGLQRASKRLEIATKALEKACHLYSMALTALNQKTILTSKCDEPAVVWLAKD